jgi:hypothetical protein
MNSQNTEAITFDLNSGIALNNTLLLRIPKGRKLRFYYITTRWTGAGNIVLKAISGGKESTLPILPNTIIVEHPIEMECEDEINFYATSAAPGQISFCISLIRIE